MNDERYDKIYRLLQLQTTLLASIYLAALSLTDDTLEAELDPCRISELIHLVEELCDLKEE